MFIELASYQARRYRCILCLGRPAGVVAACDCLKAQTGYSYFLITKDYIVPRFVHEINFPFLRGLKILYKLDQEHNWQKWYSIDRRIIG